MTKPAENCPGMPDSPIDLDDLANALKALGHPSRLEILRQLTIHERCCGGEICDCLPLAQSTISQHLDLLKSTGLVEWQQEGNRSIFTLNRERLADLGDALNAIANHQICKRAASESKAP